MKLGDIIRMIGAGTAANGPGVDPRGEPAGYSIDSRTLQPGDLFFAIRGENNDGHDYVAEALAKGALAAVVAGDWTAAQSPDAIRPQLIAVSDPLAALQALAAGIMQRWQGRTIAITGSMGKTSTKDLAAAVMMRGGRVVKTLGNLNNAFGLPLSILRMASGGAQPDDFDFAVLEMGMNHPGELTDLTRIAPPDVGVVTNVSAVHLEYFSSVEEIAQAKSELVLGIKPGGIAVLNADDDRVVAMKWLRRDIEVRSFGVKREATVSARNVQPLGVLGTRFDLATPRGEVPVALRLAGKHNLYNALAAAAVGDIFGVSIESMIQALESASSPRSRGEVLDLEDGPTLVDDSYNSNPAALAEMVAAMAVTPGFKRRVVVAGEMLELGPSAPELHRDAGREIADAGIEIVIGVRGLAEELVTGSRRAGMSNENAIFCPSTGEAVELLNGIVRSGDLVLVKGSRGVKTEAVVEELKRKWGAVKGKEQTLDTDAVPVPGPGTKS